MIWLSYLYKVYSVILDKLGYILGIIVFMALWIMRFIFVIFYVITAPLFMPVIMMVKYFFYGNDNLWSFLRKSRG